MPALGMVPSSEGGLSRHQLPRTGPMRVKKQNAVFRESLAKVTGGSKGPYRVP